MNFQLQYILHYRSDYLHKTQPKSIFVLSMYPHAVCEYAPLSHDSKAESTISKLYYIYGSMSGLCQPD